MEIELDVMSINDIDESVSLIRVAMNENEAGWAKETMIFHFTCKNHELDSGRDYFVWRHDGKIKGLVGLHHYVWGPEENVWLGWFAVHPANHGRGIGSKLLCEIERIAKSLGYTKFLVETYDHLTFDRARAFYEANGFAELGRISNYLPDGSAMVVYGKELG